MSRTARTAFMSLALSVIATFGLGACGGKASGGGNTQSATCSDGTKNGAETAVDCGGASCLALGKTCANGQGCGTSADCASGYCDPSFVCTTPSCGDGVKNGSETGTDCGASCFLADPTGAHTTCPSGQGCVGNGDCLSGFCNTQTHLCAAPSCTDGFRNGNETDVDCGGSCALLDPSSPHTTCALTQGCAAGGDCLSGLCDPNSHVCIAVTCTADGIACPSAPGACCSGYCDGTQCATPPTCKTNGTTCSSGTECCTGNCPATTPPDPQICTSVGGCTANAVACPGGGGACCSGYCNTGTSLCADPPTCTANGSGCGFNADCCSSYCDASKVCATYTCKANGSSCTSDGACCEGYCNPVSQQCAVPLSTCTASGEHCTANADCCSTACNNPTHGTLTGTCTTTTYCKVRGGACTDSSECCSMSCAGGVCADQVCKATGVTCGSGAECCTGSCNVTCQALPAPSGTSACKTLGDACTLPGDCCSTNCQGGKCTPAYLCHAASDVCYRGADCCSGMCTAPTTQTSPPTPGRCLAPSGGCNQDGEPCSGASNCCTRLCKDVGAGVTVCQPASGCRMTGDFCDHTASCCGGSNPTSPGVVESPYGVFCDGTYGPPSTAPEFDSNSKNDHTCTGGQACNPPGNICGGSGAVPASQNCCEGKKAVCKQDANGIYRCFGGCPNNDCTTCPTGYDANTPGCCIQAGNVCQFRDQCCNFLPCVPGADGVLRCTEPTCTAVGGNCDGADDSSCCSGTVCTAGGGGSWTCQVPGSCKTNGTGCTYANECCSSNCSDGVCAAPCTGTSGGCTTDTDCCAGLTCHVPLGATAGTCQSASTCAATGTACNQTSDCCPQSPALECDVNLHICQVPATCQAQLDSCTTSTQCCAQSPALHCIDLNGGLCSGGEGCVCDTCLYSGQTGCATGGGSCCLGLTCSSNTCLSCQTVGGDCSTGGQSACCPGGQPALTCAHDATGDGSACTSGGTGCTCEVCLPLGQSCVSGGERCCGPANECLRPGSVGCMPGDTDCTCQGTGT